jgi:hypothetical protein
MGLLIIGIIVFFITLFLSFYLVKRSKRRLTVQHRLFMVRKTKELNKYSVLLLLAGSVFYFLLMKRLSFVQEQTVITYIILTALYIAVFIYSIVKEIIHLKDAALNLPIYIMSRIMLLGGIAFFMLFFYLFLIN